MLNNRELPTGIAIVGGTVIVAVTGTSWLADRYPGADAVMVATPIFSAITWGCTAGTLAPAGMNTLPGDTSTFFVLLLVSVTVTPPAGAGVPSVTGNGADPPSAMETGERVMLAGTITVMLTVDSAIAGRALTWIVVDPPPTPPTGTTAKLPFAGIVTLGGTLATPGLSELTASVSAVGVGEESANVTLTVLPRCIVW